MMRFPESIPGLQRLTLPTLAASLSLLTPGALLAESADQSQIDALKAQMQQMQKQYEQRIDAMEAQMKTLESKADQGSILNTRVLTDSNGTEMGGKGPVGPVLDESFLKSLTRYFTFSAYIRSGVGFNGNGGPQDFSFIIPENVGGRFRLGNENDTYMELTWQQSHMLGESHVPMGAGKEVTYGPNVPNVSMTFTPAFVYNQDKATFVDANPQRGPNAGWDFSMRQAFIEMSNFISSAPEVTIWGGERFYDRHDIHMHDLFIDDYSGYGMGIQNIDLGFGKLDIAYLGSIRDDTNSFNQTNFSTVFGAPNFGIGGAGLVTVNDLRHSGFYMHTFDARIKDIDLGIGKLELIGDFQYFKGGTYQLGSGLPALQVGDTPGYRVGAIFQAPFGNKSFWQLMAFWAQGASAAMQTDIPTGQIASGYNLALAERAFNADGSISSSALRHASRFRGSAQLTWNVTDNFYFQAEAHYQYDDQGALSVQTGTVPVALGISPITGETGGSTQEVGAGIRPIWQINDWFAIQGQAGFEYVDRVRGFQNSGAFGRSGEMGIFTIAPTIRPKGGFFSRPEFRVFGTYAIWSNSLKGFAGGTSPITGESVYSGTNQGWVFGVQTEWFF